MTYEAGESPMGFEDRPAAYPQKGRRRDVKDETAIATVAEPGAVFGELSILLDQPHTADVLALETSQFHVAEATSLLTHNPIAVLYVATVLAHRLDGANHALFQLKGQLQAGQPHSVVVQTVARVEGLLAVSSASLLYAGYPFDPHM